MNLKKSNFSIIKNLGLLPTTIHNIVKRFRESREISVCGNAGNLSCGVKHINTWSGIRQKTTVIYHSLPLHYEMQSESLLRKEKAKCQLYTVMPWCSLGQSSSQIIKKTGTYFEQVGGWEINRGWGVWGVVGHVTRVMRDTMIQNF